ncbi:MAG TPA: hypothetical protein VFM94_00600 [Solirubrobacterales bacterium]|nr:hypothetical protein [Solirubrobacterales bacterium]
MVLLHPVALRNEGPGVERGAGVGTFLASWELDLAWVDRLVRDLFEQMGDQVEPGGTLVIRLDDEPGRILGVRLGEHLDWLSLWEPDTGDWELDEAARRRRRRKLARAA